ncbi:FAD-dependent oxidoreductase [Lyngbya confervoides]|uniref:FAD-dependent oxidoreductase n=1 Tax=Lyngbya confervoides BDU141951 TaxID=1574623 RepID=A0ABD4T5G6_9CYAN|nr:FAD-dependent oxidoreductase [Lyngbya confervoides]MCM1983767.1 FAD-dependent oxidoreductase [Lyngbya confervoides BDU141951]
MNQLSGKPISFWIESTPTPHFEPLSQNIPVDVAIVGGGIAGLSAAFKLKQAGKTVAVIEARRLASTASGHTTAKITSLHQLIYAQLIAAQGEQKAKMYADSNQAAITQIAAWVEQEQIDCDFQWKSAYTFTESELNLEQITGEVEAAVRLGLPATFVTEVSLPFPIAGAIKFENQAQFHVRKYLLHLANKIAGNGSHVFESTRVKTVERGTPCEVITDQGTILAQDVIVTTNLPILDQGLFFAKAYPKRSYLVAAKINPSQAPDGMFISIDDPYRSIRTTPWGEDLLLFIGGEGHKVGSESHPEDRYQALETYGRERFGIERFDYRWSSQDVKSFDHLPYIGPLTPLDQHIFVATGFSLWGMTHGTLSGMILSDRILGNDNPWASLYDSTRATPFLSQTSLKENLDVGKHWIGDRLKGLNQSSFEDIKPGEGKILTLGGQKVAASRDKTGAVHTVSAVCSHLGCIVNWNSAEKSWDCPCHGARFSGSGQVLNGPAVQPLQTES